MYMIVLDEPDAMITIKKDVEEVRGEDNKC
jgi:hypothetical protein